MKNELKINFVDFWPDFQKKDNYFFHLLSQKYLVRIEENDPDIVFGSYGFSQEKEIHRYSSHRCLKVYYTGESDGPRSFPYDVNITQMRNLDSQFHIRLPLWAFFCSWFNETPIVHSRDPSVLCPINNLVNPSVDFEMIYHQKKKFCSFLYADETYERNFWFDQLSRISFVEASGNARNNTGYKIPGRGDQFHKLSYMSEFFFSLAIENKSANGYLTEKMLHPLTVFSIPIYWGDPQVINDFNPKCFIDARGMSHEKVLEEIIELTKDKRRYIEKMSAPRIDLKKLDFIPQNVINFLDRHVNLKKTKNSY